jgi:LysR family glycine cleavage system transcriptional activator
VTARTPSLESLRFLEASGRLESFSRAARELHVSPAAVSLRIRDLEADLGVTLFHRRGPRVIATEACTALTRALGEAFGAVASAVEACRAEAGLLRVTAPPTFAVRWLAPRLGDRIRGPAVTVEASTLLLPSTRFDVAIRAGAGAWPGLEARPLFPVEGSPMMSPALVAGRRLAGPQDLAGFPLLPDDRWPRWFSLMGVEAPRLNVLPMKFATQELMASAVMQGHGVALLAPRMFAAALRDGALVQPFAGCVEGPEAFHVAWREGDARAAVRDFVEWLLGDVDRPA